MKQIYTSINKPNKILLLFVLLPVIILASHFAMAQDSDHTISIFPYMESFEYVYGKWTQDSEDDFDWTLNVGMTPTDETGPMNAYEGDCYIYIKAATNNPSHRAMITSPDYDISRLKEPVLAFAYNMNGSDIGTLEVLISTDNGATWKERLCFFSGDKGNTWYVANLDLRRFSGSEVTFRIAGITGEGPEGDLAIDYVYVGERSDFRFNDERNTISKPFNVKVNFRNQRLHVEVPEEFVCRSSLEVINLLGNRVHSNALCDSRMISMDVSGLDGGLYFLRIYHQGEIYTKKVYINN